MWGTCLHKFSDLKKKHGCADYEKCLTCGRRTERLFQVIVAGIKWLQECEAGTVNTKAISTILRASAIMNSFFFPLLTVKDALLCFSSPYHRK